MCCGITKRKQGVKFFQTLLSLFALNRLWFVDYQHRICLCNYINRTAGTKFIKFHINSSCVLAFCIESLRIYDHNIDIAVRRKAVNFGQPCGIIYEKAYLFAVFLRKMLLRYLKRLKHALTNSNTRYYHNEFTPTVCLVQLIHSLDISVCLADTCFHFYCEIISALQFIRGLYLI